MTDLLQMVMDLTGWDKKKAQEWFNTSNPFMMDMTPNGYELSEGKEELINMIHYQFLSHRQYKHVN